MTDTTTEAATQDDLGGAPAPQPVEQPAEAVTPPVEPTSTPPAPDEPAAPATENSDDDLTDYWSKKGIDISTPEGQAQAAKSYREAEKSLTQNAQRASELEKQINAQPAAEVTTDPAVQEAIDRAARVETTLEVERWKAANNITPEQDAAVGQYLVDNPQKAWLVKNGHLSLDDVYAMSGVGKTDPAALKKEGGQEALQTLADKQLATAPTGSAATSAPAANEDPILAVLQSDD
jgi:hypothetical protein